jgi:hypothetical protein
MGWWPFSRKRKLSISNPIQPTSSAAPGVRPQPPYRLEPPPPMRETEKLTPRQSTIHPALRTNKKPSTPNKNPNNPFDDENSLTALPPTPGSLQRQASGHLVSARSQPGLGRVSFDTNREALGSRRGIEHSPHLRPVPESDLHRSASTRSRLSTDILRRKSTKKTPPPKREQQMREISRSMSNVKRSADAVRPMTKDSKRSRPSGNYSHRPNQSSVESFKGLGEARPSTAGWGDHSHLALKPSGVLSPRPTLHYTLSNTQHYAASAPASSRLDVVAGKLPVSRNGDSRTIDELADDLDASALRQLMDRDQKRQDRKRKEQEERARRRLERYAARGEDTETALYRRQLAELDMAAANAVSNIDQDRGRQMNRKQHDSAVSAETHGSTIYDPFADPDEVMAAVRSGHSIFPNVPQTATEYSVSPPARGRSIRMSPPTSPSQATHQRSNLTLVTKSRNDMSSNASQEVLRPTTSESISRKGPLSSLFRRSVRSGINSTSEGSFSNTSRDSMAKMPLPAHLQDRQMSPILAATGPLRSVSKFREDLPELPLSPPDSRLASPSVPEYPPIPEPQSVPEAGTLESALRPSMSLIRPTTSVQHQSIPESPILPPHPYSYDSPMPTSPTAGSELADIDAEATWMSGRSNRASVRSSMGRTPRSQRAATFSTSYESIPYVREEVETDDPFGDSHGIDKVTSHHSNAPQMKDLRASLMVRDEEDSTDGEDLPEPTPVLESSQMTHGSVARTPTVIRHNPRMKSTEGLLKRLDTSGSSIVQLSQAGVIQQVTPPRKGSEDAGYSAGSTPTSPMETPWVESAHARHLSTGSARLLHIPARGNSLRNSLAGGSPAFSLTPTGHTPMPSPGMQGMDVH